MEQSKYQHSDKLPLSLIVEELERDAELTDKALQILSVEDRESTYTKATAVSGLINHWLVNRDVNCYINGKQVDDVTALTVLPVDGDYGAGIKALENWMFISMDELAELLEHRNLAVPAFLRPVGVTVINPSGDSNNPISTANLVYWRVILNSNIKKIDGNKKTDVRKIIKYLRGLGDKRLPDKGSTDELFWIDDMGTERSVEKKTVNNAASDARKLP